MIYAALEADHQKALIDFAKKTKKRLERQVLIGSKKCLLLRNGKRSIILTQMEAMAGFYIGLTGLLGLIALWVFNAPFLAYIIPLFFIALQGVFTKPFTTFMLWLGLRKAGVQGKITYVTKNKIIERLLR